MFDLRLLPSLDYSTIFAKPDARSLGIHLSLVDISIVLLLRPMPIGNLDGDFIGFARLTSGIIDFSLLYSVSSTVLAFLVGLRVVTVLGFSLPKAYLVLRVPKRTSGFEKLPRPAASWLRVLDDTDAHSISQTFAMR